jgi:hypothetical protein
MTAMKTVIKTSISRSPLRLGFLLFPLALAWLALSSTAQALLPPPAPDGGYPNLNTAEGSYALYYNTDGFENTANGSQALFNNTTGAGNTVTGAFALDHNIDGRLNTATGDSSLKSNTSGSNNTANGG